MKTNWTQIENLKRRNDLKKVAKKMRRRGYLVTLENYDGKWAVRGTNKNGGAWTA